MATELGKTPSGAIVVPDFTLKAHEDLVIANILIDAEVTILSWTPVSGASLEWAEVWTLDPDQKLTVRAQFGSTWKYYARDLNLRSVMHAIDGSTLYIVRIPLGSRAAGDLVELRAATSTASHNITYWNRSFVYRAAGEEEAIP